jgi:hypothetical protein
MHFGFGIEIDHSIDRFSRLAIALEDEINRCCGKKHYGSDLQHISVGLILTNPEGNDMHPIRPFRFTKLVKIALIKKELHNVAEYDIKPNFPRVRQMTDTEFRRHLCHLLIESTETLERHRTKYPNFDVERFRGDLQACVEAYVRSQRE